MQGRDFFAFAVGEIDEHQGVVDQHPGQGHHAEQAHDAERVAHEQVPDHGPHDAEGDAEHDDERLDVASEGDGQQGEDGHQGQEQAGEEALHRVAQVGLAAFEAAGQTRVAGGEPGQGFGFERRDHLLGLLVRPDVGRDRDDPAAVVVADGGVGLPWDDPGRVAQQDLAPGGAADDQVLQGGFAGPFFFGQSDQHRDLVAAALLAQGLGAVEGVAHLVGHGFGGQLHALPCGQELDVVLPLAACRAVVDVVDVAEVAEFGAQLASGQLQHVLVPVTQAHGEALARAGPAAVGLEAEGFQAGQWAGALPPQVRDPPSTQGPDLGRGQEETYFDGGLVHDAEHAFGQRLAAVLPDHLLGGLDQGPLRGADPGLGGPGRQRGFHVGVVGIDLGKEDHAHAAGFDVADGGQEDGQAEGQDAVAMPQGEGQKRLEPLVQESFEGVAEPGLQPDHAAEDPGGLRVLDVGQVGRQHEQGFDERDREHADHHRGDVAEDLAHDPGQKEQGHEGHDVGQHAEGHGHGHLAHAVHRGP